VSDGANKTPIWKSLNDATGIKASDVVNASGTSVVVTGITTMEDNDKVLITVEGASGVVAQVTDIDVGAGFTVSFSGSFTGKVHYLVMN
jgi:hypothetical protein